MNFVLHSIYLEYFVCILFKTTLEHISTPGCIIQVCANGLWAGRDFYRATPAVTLDRPFWSPCMISNEYWRPILTQSSPIFKPYQDFFCIKLTCYRCNDFETKYIVNDFPSFLLLSKQYDAFFMTSCRYEDCNYIAGKIYIRVSGLCIFLQCLLFYYPMKSQRKHILLIFTSKNLILTSNMSKINKIIDIIGSVCNNK